MLREPSPTSLLLLPLAGFCWLEKTESKTMPDHECHSDVASRPVACVAPCRMPLEKSRRTYFQYFMITSTSNGSIFRCTLISIETVTEIGHTYWSLKVRLN